MSRRLSVFPLAAAFLAAATLVAVPAAAQDRGQCLRQGEIYGFSPIKGNERALIVTDRANRRYKVTTMYRCAGLDFNFAVGIKTLERGRLACVSRGDTIISRDPGVAGDRCPIASIELYTPAMERADREAARMTRR
jgi:hypothetical protein